MASAPAGVRVTDIAFLPLKEWNCKVVPLDADDIARLYQRHARSLVTYFTRRTYDAQVAVELTAETFAAAAADRAAFRGSGDEAATGWLYGIARHQLSSWYRRAQVERRATRRWGLDSPVLEDAEYERIEELAGLAELRASVAAAMSELKPRDQEAVRLRIVEERPYEDVAHALGVSEQTARARVSRALRQLAASVEASAPDRATVEPATEVGGHGAL